MAVDGQSHKRASTKRDNELNIKSNISREAL